MEQKTTKAMQSFVAKLMDKVQRDNTALMIEYDEQWPSVCYQEHKEPGSLVKWQPMAQHETQDWQNLASALELDLHESVSQFFQTFWSHHLKAMHSNGPIELIQVWNAEDAQRLQQNMVGHILMKRRLKHPETLFFALTEQEDVILSVENQTGAVVVEHLGKKPTQIIAEDLASFINSLNPLI
jgi:SecY interacting protein Syd